MDSATCPPSAGVIQAAPTELLDLWDRIRALPAETRAELEPVVRGALEEARFRSRVLTVAREALERFRLDLEMVRFDLDTTRREKERLMALLSEVG